MPLFYSKVLCKRLFLAISRKNSTVLSNLTEMMKKMPLDKKHQTVFRTAYENRKKKTEKFKGSNNNVRIEVIGSGAHGSPKSVYLCVGPVRYLFNCGEGTQRLANEYKIKLCRTTPHIFVTYPCWSNVSGLLGMALSLQSVGIPEFCIHGPLVIENVFSATNKFVALRTISLKMMESLPGRTYDDGNLCIEYVHLYPNTSFKVNENMSDTTITSDSSKKISNCQPSEEKANEDIEGFDDIDYYEHEKKVTKSNVQKKAKKRSQSVSYRNANKEKYAVSYICSTKKVLGTLSYEKCVELGVPCGPILGKLKNGEDITLEDGTVVKSSDVKKPDQPGVVIIVLECPSKDYLESLLQQRAFYRYQSGDSTENAAIVVHFTPAKIAKEPKYKEWIRRFPKSTKHLFVNEDNKCLGSVGIQRLQYKLNLLHPEIFPLLPDCGIPSYPRGNTKQSHKIIKREEKSNKPDYSEMKETDFLDEVYYHCGEDPFIEAETMCRVYLKPECDYHYSKPLVLRKKDFIQEAFSVNGFAEKLEQLKNEISKVEENEILQKEYPKILFLGTGSSQPSKLRNTSGILVFLDENTPMLMDCGESTYNQIVQFFGVEKTREILRKLKVIYVSHLHADHHIGLITLLRERKSSFEEFQASQPQCENNSNSFKPIILLAPIQLTRWINLFSQEFEDVSSLFDFLPCAALSLDKSFFNEKYSKCLQLLNLKEIKTTLVKHCPHAFGVAIIHNSGWKLTYSGDTMPCKDLVTIGQNSDILIHEATMDDSLAKVAASKLHSTTSQAISIGKQMNAKFILLTHFSQRYSHLPFIDDNFTDEVGIAFDNMLVSMKQLPILSKFKETLKTMFSVKYESMLETKNLQMLKKKKRKSSVSDEPVKKVKSI